MALGNPVFSDRTFGREMARPDQRAMTVQGTVKKAGILLLVVAASAVWTWRTLSPWADDARVVWTWTLFAMVAGLAVAVMTWLKHSWAAVTGPVYAFFEGVVVGGVSLVLERTYPGVAVQAVGLTFAMFVALLLLYSTRAVRVTPRMAAGVAMAVLGVLIVYLVDLVLRFAGMSIPYLHESGPVGIVVSLVIAVIAASNLLVSFATVEDGAGQGSPKHMEWYGAFGLTVSLVWLYLEVLRLISKLKD